MSEEAASKTLRDEFAMAALPALLTLLEGQPIASIKRAMDKAGVENIQELCAHNAYDIADEMMRKRAK